MKHRFLAVLAVVGFGLLLPRITFAQGPSGYMQGFGGMTLGNASMDGLFGGEVGANLGSHVQVFGEGGYMRDTLSSTFLGSLIDVAADATGVNVRRSGFYADGGVRLLTSGGPVRGYVEGSAGAVRLSYGVDLDDRLGLSPVINTALNFLDRTEPMVGFGGGVILQPGRVMVDLGYRHQRVLAGTPFGINQVRAAIGVTF
jgi:hypothetical protein